MGDPKNLIRSICHPLRSLCLRSIFREDLVTSYTEFGEWEKQFYAKGKGDNSFLTGITSYFNNYEGGSQDRRFKFFFTTNENVVSYKYIYGHTKENDWDKPLKVETEDNEAFVAVWSQFSSHRKDRKFVFEKRIFKQK